MDLNTFLQKSREELVIPQGISDSHFMRVEVDGKKMSVQKVYDVEPVLKRAEFYRKVNESSRGFSKTRTRRHIGCLPTAIWLRIHRECGGDDKEMAKRVKQFLRHNPQFRTSEGDI